MHGLYLSNPENCKNLVTFPGLYWCFACISKSVWSHETKSNSFYYDWTAFNEDILTSYNAHLQVYWILQYSGFNGLAHSYQSLD